MSSCASSLRLIVRWSGDYRTHTNDWMAIPMTVILNRTAGLRGLFDQRRSPLSDCTQLQLLNLKFEILVFHVPLEAAYWFTYQNVQPSGATAVLV